MGRASSVFMPLRCDLCSWNYLYWWFQGPRLSLSPHTRGVPNNTKKLVDSRKVPKITQLLYAMCVLAFLCKAACQGSLMRSSSWSRAEQCAQHDDINCVACMRGMLAVYTKLSTDLQNENKQLDTRLQQNACHSMQKPLCHGAPCKGMTCKFNSLQ